MAESDPPTPDPAAEANKAQAEFHSYKDRLEQAGPGATAPPAQAPAQAPAPATGPGASFASPLPSSAIPAWSLRPGPVTPHGPPGAAGPGSYAAAPAPSGGGGYGAIVDGVGNTIRLGVEVLNAALSGGLQMINGYGYGGGWDSGPCDCEECNPCGGYDCCKVMGSGCGCCEPSVGSCC
jgi:hypothetical protein